MLTFNSFAGNMIKRSVKQEQNDAVCYPEPYILSLTLIFFLFSRDVWLRARKATFIFKKKAT